MYLKLVIIIDFYMVEVRILLSFNSILWMILVYMCKKRFGFEIYFI